MPRRRPGPPNVFRPPRSETAPRDRSVSGSSVLRTRGGSIVPGRNTVRDYGSEWRGPTPGSGRRRNPTRPPQSEQYRGRPTSPPKSEQRFTGSRRSNFNLRRAAKSRLSRSR